MKDQHADERQPLSHFEDFNEGPQGEDKSQCRGDILGVTTPYGNAKGMITSPHPDAEDRHRLMKVRAYQLASRYPWFFRLLLEAGARVSVKHGVFNSAGQLVESGGFFLAFPSAPGEWIEVSELRAELTLAPWRDDETEN